MNPHQLEPYLLLLYNRVPLIGGWARRLAARALAAEGSPVAVGALAEAVARSDDARVRAIALAAISRPMEYRCVDKVCAVWAATRNADLAALLMDTTWNVNAKQPPRRQDSQEKDREKTARENEKPTL